MLTTFWLGLLPATAMLIVAASCGAGVVGIQDSLDMATLVIERFRRGLRARVLAGDGLSASHAANAIPRLSQTTVASTVGEA